MNFLYDRNGSRSKDAKEIILNNFKSFTTLTEEQLNEKFEDFKKALDYYGVKFYFSRNNQNYKPINNKEFNEILQENNYSKLEKIVFNPHLTTEQLGKILKYDDNRDGCIGDGYGLLLIISNRGNCSFELLENFYKRENEHNKVIERLAQSDMVKCLCAFIETYGNNPNMYPNLKHTCFTQYFHSEKSNKLLKELVNDNDLRVRNEAMIGLRYKILNDLQDESIPLSHCLDSISINDLDDSRIVDTLITRFSQYEKSKEINLETLRENPNELFKTIKSIDFNKEDKTKKIEIGE